MLCASGLEARTTGDSDCNKGATSSSCLRFSFRHVCNLSSPHVGRTCRITRLRSFRLVPLLTATCRRRAGRCASGRTCSSLQEAPWPRDTVQRPALTLDKPLPLVLSAWDLRVGLVVRLLGPSFSSMRLDRFFLPHAACRSLQEPTWKKRATC